MDIGLNRSSARFHFILSPSHFYKNISMLSQAVTIVNKLGLHARAAAKLVRLASSFESNISIKRQQREVNGKSIMGVMMLAASKGTEIEIIVEGSDEALAMQALYELIGGGFGEEE